jgi:Na+/H+ antiporter NhaD/arsenite permease-like protein
MLSIVILAAVFLLIAIRQIGRIRFRIWQAMLMGALAVLLTGQITPLAAVSAIDLDVICFLFGMFITGQALEESGYLAHISQRFFRLGTSTSTLALLIIFGSGILAAVLMNDTLAIVGTPLLLMLAQKNQIHAKPLLLALTFGITTGSVLSPIGNPQNLLIALGGNITNPFLTFFRYLALPTLVNMLVVYVMLRIYYPRFFETADLNPDGERIMDARLARLCQISLVLLGTLIGIKIILVFIAPQLDFRLTYISLISALPILLFSKRRFTIIKRLDWPTLIFFASMFILMASVWESGIFQSVMEHLNLDWSNQGIVLGISVILSQFISNVPMVALYIPVLSQTGASTGIFMALAAGSTIAGNLTILGAASNVIIIQSCENKSGETITFREFFRIGLPLTAIQILIYWLFLYIST